MNRMPELPSPGAALEPAESTETAVIETLTAEKTDKLLRELFPAAYKVKRPDRAIVQIDLMRAPSSGSRGELWCGTSLWFYDPDGASAVELTMMSRYAESRMSLRWCPRNGCLGHEYPSGVNNDSFMCPVCGTITARGNMHTSSFYAVSRDELARNVERLWLSFPHGGCDILAVVHKQKNLRNVQRDGRRAKSSASAYQSALSRATDREEVVYRHEKILSDVGAGGTVFSKMRAFLRAL
jgi:hypothetical protein